MAKNVEQRYASAALFAAALRSAFSRLDVGTTGGRTDDYVLPVDDRVDRVPVLVWCAVAGGLALLVAMGYWALAG